MVGEQIAAARRSSELSLEELARRTRIPAVRLKALEAGMYELLPPPIFSRGYVRACARELGLDPDRLVRQFDAERAVTAAEEQPAVSRPVPVEEIPGTWERLRGAALMALGIATVVFLMWTGREPAGRAADVRSAGPAPASGLGVPPAAVATTGDAAPEREGVSVDLSAERVCWVAARADGARVIYRLMQPGERATVSAANAVVLRAGDAGALTISVNGEAPYAFGSDGQVQTATFTPARDGGTEQAP